MAPLPSFKPKPLQKDYNRQVLFCALISRVLVVALIFIWRSLISPYDTSASINSNCLSPSPDNPSNSSSKESMIFNGAAKSIEESIVWDGVYLVRIAECGYEYEQTYAFLPLLPLCISLLTKTVFAPLVPLLGYRAVLGLSAYLLNNASFVIAAVYFYKLSVLILMDSEAAMRASTLFCFNAASIFYSSIYSESLYALLSLGGLYHLISGAGWKAVFLLALSGSARSNGLLNAGYLCFQAMHRAYDAIFHKKHAGLAAKAVFAGILQSLCIFTPFIAFQAYGYFNICKRTLSVDIMPWCHARIPYLYGFLQSHYWGVGFLRYFQIKQLPNFLLATPVLSLAVCSIVRYAHLRPKVFFSLGFLSSQQEKDSADVFYSWSAKERPTEVQIMKTTGPHNKSTGGDQLLRRRKKNKDVAIESIPGLVSSDQDSQNYSIEGGYSSILLVPFILHLGFMVVVAFFVMHVQVSTRFLSANPPIYWFAAYLMCTRRNGFRWGYLIWAYCVAYILLGSLLFSNFYPFT
ncbi:GPI mannosyltransferase 2 [Amborella trichopoda]|uniref:GPI mannosyltransferase 2 n=1 Tax=Amborella trichopoda TaxID=13333 RepID=UPI0005D3D811|nr:GPI mannosyltransferase 2 [Amborella trichopoda]|eukprot:XP_011625278.1 GPI mannosyltransferase 2 [Amborella trichopoda]